MKFHLTFLFVLLGFVGPVCAQTSSVPKVISDGFATYKAVGADKAVESWFAGSLLATDLAAKAKFVTVLTNFEVKNGRYSGYESIGSVVLSPSVKYCYVVFLYDNAPLYAWFEVYTVGDKDIVTSYQTNPIATEILPASFFVKNKSG